MALPAGYVGLFNILSRRANEHGYALALHGSLKKDMDIMAMPWTPEAISPAELVYKLTDAITFLKLNVMMDDQFHDNPPTFPRSRIDGPEAKPHGRLAWNIQLGGGCFIDISVMPRDMDRQPVVEEAAAPVAAFDPTPVTSLRGIISDRWTAGFVRSFVTETSLRALYQMIQELVADTAKLPAAHELVVYHWRPRELYGYGLMRRVEGREAMLDASNFIAVLTAPPADVEVQLWPWEVVP